MKLIKYVLKTFRANGFFLALIFTYIRLIKKVRSIFYSRVLNAPGINLGAGCQIFGKNHIKFGKEISVHKNLWLEAVSEYNQVQYYPDILLGDRVKMSDGVHITAINKIEIGADVLLGSNVYISDHNHGIYSGESAMHSNPSERPAERKLYSSGAVLICNNVWIGDNVNIVGPVTIGNSAIIASNSVVRSDVAPETIVAGMPAKPIKKFNHDSKKWEKYV
jgi:lipopolysaccharide O-acetyltransferase